MRILLVLLAAGCAPAAPRPPFYACYPAVDSDGDSLFFCVPRTTPPVLRLVPSQPLPTEPTPEEPKSKL